jgi:hypothetical protein
MALALNVFKTVTHVVTTTSSTIYTAPASYTGIVLLAQITNISNTFAAVTFSTVNNGIETELLKSLQIPANDAISGITGRLIIPTGSSIKISSSANNQLKITLSILETANE